MNKYITRRNTEIAYQRLARQLVDPQYGLVHSLQVRYPRPGEPAVYTAQARLSYSSHDAGLRFAKVGGSGAGIHEAQAQISALCESVERYCLYAGKLDVIVDSYANLNASIQRAASRPMPTISCPAIFWNWFRAIYSRQ